MNYFKGDIELKQTPNYSLLKVFWFKEIKDDSEIKHTSQIILNVSCVYKASYKKNHEK